MAKFVTNIARLKRTDRDAATVLSVGTTLGAARLARKLLAHPPRPGLLALCNPCPFGLREAALHFSYQRPSFEVLLADDTLIAETRVLQRAHDLGSAIRDCDELATDANARTLMIRMTLPLINVRSKIS